MLEQFQAIYTTQKWVKYMTCLGVLTAGAFLFWFSGGFPPQAWRFLLQMLPLVPRLWMIKGPLMLVPLVALLTLCFTLLFFWLILVGVILWMVKEQWSYLRERQRFEASLMKAKNLASSEMVSRQWWEEQTEPIPQVGRRELRQTQFSASSPVATLDPPLSRDSDVTPIALSSHMEATTEPTDAVKSGGERYFKLAVGTGLDAGIKRKSKPNEDRLLAIQGTLASDASAQPFGLFVIADGIGGHANGQEASRLVIQTIRDVVIPALLSEVTIDDELSAELLMEAVHEANRCICEYNEMYKTDIGSTVTAALIVGKTISIANVGDSRTYIYRQYDGLTKVTRDHSVVARMVENGSISAEDVYSHPRRNEIYRSLGHKVALDVDMYVLRLETEIALLLCSDGLWEMVRDPHIQDIMNSTLPHAAKTSRVLVQAALDGGGQDNISVVVVHIT